MAVTAPDPPEREGITLSVTGDFMWGRYRKGAIQAATQWCERILHIRSLPEEERRPHLYHEDGTPIDLDFLRDYSMGRHWHIHHPSQRIWERAFVKYLLERLNKDQRDAPEIQEVIEIDAHFTYNLKYIAHLPYVLREALVDRCFMAMWRCEHLSIDEKHLAVGRFIPRLTGHQIDNYGHYLHYQVHYASRGNPDFHMSVVLRDFQDYIQGRNELAHAQQANVARLLMQKGLPRSLISYGVEPFLGGLPIPGQRPVLRPIARPGDAVPVAAAAAAIQLEEENARDTRQRLLTPEEQERAFARQRAVRLQTEADRILEDERNRRVRQPPPPPSEGN